MHGASLWNHSFCPGHRPWPFLSCSAVAKPPPSARHCPWLQPYGFHTGLPEKPEVVAHFGEKTCSVRPVARGGAGTKPSLPDLQGEQPRARGPWQRGERGRRKLLGFALAGCAVPAGTSATPRPGDVSGTVLQMKAPKLVWVLFPTHRVLSYESLGSPIHGVQNNELATFCQKNKLQQCREGKFSFPLARAHAASPSSPATLRGSLPAREV